MIDQYPFEGFTDQYPDTKITPDWWGFGHRNLEQRTSPVKHIVYADGQRHAIIEVRHDDQQGSVQSQIMDRLKSNDAEQPHLSVSQSLSYARTPGNGHWGDTQHQFPDTRPGRHHKPKGWGV